MEDYECDPPLFSAADAATEDDALSISGSSREEVDNFPVTPSRAVRSRMLSQSDDTVVGDTFHDLWVVTGDDCASVRVEEVCDDSDSNGPPIDDTVIFHDDDGKVCLRGKEIARKDYIRYLGRRMDAKFLNNVAPTYPPPSRTVNGFHYFVRVTSASSVKSLSHDSAGPWNQSNGTRAKYDKYPAKKQGDAYVHVKVGDAIHRARRWTKTSLPRLHRRVNYLEDLEGNLLGGYAIISYVYTEPGELLDLSACATKEAVAAHLMTRDPLSVNADFPHLKLSQVNYVAKGVPGRLKRRVGPTKRIDFDELEKMHREGKYIKEIIQRPDRNIYVLFTDEQLSAFGASLPTADELQATWEEDDFFLTLPSAEMESAINAKYPCRGYAKGMCMLDSTFNFTNALVVPLIYSNSSFKSVSDKFSMEIAATLITVGRTAEDYQCFGEVLSRHLDRLDYTNRKIRSLTTDGEEAFRGFLKARLAIAAVHVGCQIHARENLNRQLNQYGGRIGDLLFGVVTRENGIKRRGVLDCVKESHGEAEWIRLLSDLPKNIQEIALPKFHSYMARFGIRTRIRGGWGLLPSTTNSAETHNRWLREKVGDRQPLHIFAQHLMEYTESHVKLLKAALHGGGSKKLVGSRPLTYAQKLEQFMIFLPPPHRVQDFLAGTSQTKKEHFYQNDNSMVLSLSTEMPPNILKKCAACHGVLERKIEDLPTDLVVAHFEAFEFTDRNGKKACGLGTRWMHARFSCVVGRHTHIKAQDIVLSSKMKKALTPFYREWIRRSFGIIHF